MSCPLSKSEADSVGRQLSDDEKQWPAAENPEWLKPNPKYLPCHLRFESKDCGYVGRLESCSKTIEDCRERDNVERFRGWMIRKSAPCHCSAYEFPHRFRGGDCQAPHAIDSDERKPECSECQHGMACVDPLGTGDSQTEYECGLPYCPWEGR